MRFAPIFGRFCTIFLHLVQELTPNFGDSRNKFCNIFVTILPHLFRFGETSFYGGKKCRFSSFSGCGRCPLRHGLRRATSPEVRGKGFSAAFLALPLGELSAKQTERASLLLPPAGLPSPSTPFGVATSPEVRGKGLFRHVLGSHFGGAVERSETERASSHRVLGRHSYTLGPAG